VDVFFGSIQWLFEFVIQLITNENWQSMWQTPHNVFVSSNFPKELDSPVFTSGHFFVRDVHDVEQQMFPVSINRAWWPLPGRVREKETAASQGAVPSAPGLMRSRLPTSHP
jgi:hypothetical protein